MCIHAHYYCERRSRLTTKAQRPGARGRSIVTWTRWPGSCSAWLGGVVSNSLSIVCGLESEALNLLASRVSKLADWNAATTRTQT